MQPERLTAQGIMQPERLTARFQEQGARGRERNRVSKSNPTAAVTIAYLSELIYPAIYPVGSDCGETYKISSEGPARPSWVYSVWSWIRGEVS